MSGEGEEIPPFQYRTTLPSRFSMLTPDPDRYTRDMLRQRRRREYERQWRAYEKALNEHRRVIRMLLAIPPRPLP